MRASPWPAPTPGGLGAIEVPAAGGHEERSKIVAAETAAIGTIGGESMALDHRALRREHGDQRPGPAAGPAAAGDDMAVGIEAHTFDPALRSAVVRAESVQHLAMADAAVGGDGIGAQLPSLVDARLAVSDVERRFV